MVPLPSVQLSFDVTGDNGGGESNGSDRGEDRVVFTLLRAWDWVGETGPGFVSQSSAMAMRSDVRNMTNSFDLMSFVTLEPR